MHWLAFIAACLALFLARNLRAPKSSTLLTGGLAFGCAFLVTIIGVRLGAEQLGLTRPTDYDAFVSNALDVRADNEDAPIALFVGASFSRNAINDEFMSQKLRKKGYPHRVINLSLEGASLQERHAHLMAYIDAAETPPDIVFLEAAQEFDQDPVYVFRVAKFSDRAIKQFTPEATFWAMKGLAQGQCFGLANCVKNWGLLGVHSGMNMSNLGLLATGKSRSDIPAKPSFDPQKKRRDVFSLTKAEISNHLNTIPASIAPRDPVVWSRLFRHAQRSELASRGVRKIAYYYPPVLFQDEREYIAGLCETELQAFDCIPPTNRKLLSKLDGEYWFDEKHLLAKGAKIYSLWLANEVHKRGVLK